MTQQITILLTSLSVTGTYFAIKEFVWTYLSDVYKYDYRNGEMDRIYDRTHWIYKPLFTCITCMSSVWGTFYYWVISTGLIASNVGYVSDGHLVSLLIFLPITCVSCAFLNIWFYKLIEG